jgi:hypothetical protein
MNRPQPAYELASKSHAFCSRAWQRRVGALAESAAACAARDDFQPIN